MASEGTPPAKRKKFFTKGEVVELLKQKNHKIMDVSREITEVLCPFNVDDNETEDINEKLEKLEEVSRQLTGNISRLSKEFKNRKFRNKPELLTEKEVSCSQFSVLQSGDSESIRDSEEMMDYLDLGCEEMDKEKEKGQLFTTKNP